jgi:hypothetical protein
MRRRRFLKAALGGLVGVCLPLPAIPHAKPPSTCTPGIWEMAMLDEWEAMVNRPYMCDLREEYESRSSLHHP